MPSSDCHVYTETELLRGTEVAEPGWREAGRKAGETESKPSNFESCTTSH